MGKKDKNADAEVINGTAVTLIPPNTTNKNENTKLPECRRLNAEQQATLFKQYENIFQRELTSEEFIDIDTIAIVSNGRALVSDECEPGPGKWKRVIAKKTRHDKDTGDYVTEAEISRFCMNSLEDMRLRREYPEVFAAFDHARLTRAKEGAINWLVKATSYFNKRDIEEESLKDVSQSYQQVANSLESIDKMQKRAAAAAPGSTTEDPLVLTETIIRELKCDPALLREFAKELTK